MTRIIKMLGVFVFLVVSVASVGVDQVSAVGFWTPKADMPTARYGLAATTGLDGKIYAIGGANASLIEAYNPSTNTWAQLGSTLTPRGWPAAATGLDGKIYIIGGSYNTNRLSSMEIYDPATDKLTEGPSMSIARRFLAATTGLDGKIYVIGGDDSRVLEVYDPSTGAWTRKADMTTARGGLAAATGFDGKIYAIGGTGNPTVSNLEVYDPATNIWTRKANMPSPEFGHYGIGGVIAGDGILYSIGGNAWVNINGNQTATNTMGGYDPATDEWTIKPPMTNQRIYFGATTGRDGKIYAVGGYTWNGVFASYLGSLEVYTAVACPVGTVGTPPECKTKEQLKAEIDQIVAAIIAILPTPCANPQIGVNGLICTNVPTPCPLGSLGIQPNCVPIQATCQPPLTGSFPNCFAYTQASYYSQSSYYTQAAYGPYTQASYYSQSSYTVAPPSLPPAPPVGVPTCSFIVDDVSGVELTLLPNVVEGKNVPVSVKTTGSCGAIGFSPVATRTEDGNNNSVTAPNIRVTFNPPACSTNPNYQGQCSIANVSMAPDATASLFSRPQPFEAYFTAASATGATDEFTITYFIRQ